MIWLLLERFTKNVAPVLFLLFASSSLKFFVIRMSSSYMFVAGQKLICTRRALAAQSLFRSFTVAVAAWRSDVLDKVFFKILNGNNCCCQKACILLKIFVCILLNKKGFFISVERSDFVEEFVCILLNKKGFLILVKRSDFVEEFLCILLNRKGFFISVERSDFVEEFVCILLNKKGFAFQLKEVILLKNLFCILLNKKGFAFWSKEMILLKNLVCILLNKKCVFAFELNKDVYISIL
jgi:hypothetical protein